jgi:membrane protein implicated in regulation of membrane protease activity
MIATVVSELGPWNWWIAGLLLLGFEVVLPGFFLLWLGLSAIVVGTITLTIGFEAAWWPWQVQVIVFGILSLLLAVLGRRWMSSRGEESDRPDLNDRGGQLVGRAATLEDPIVNGQGRVRIGDTVWRVDGPDLPAGTRVMVTGRDAGRLTVEADV